MSRIEKSLEKAVKLRAVSPSVRRQEFLPADFSRPYYEETEKQTHLRDYLDVLIRRKWIVILFLSTVFITGTIATFLMKPLYRGTTTIQLKKAKLDISTFKDVYHEKQDMETQYNILGSMNLAEKVKAKLPVVTKEDGTQKKLSVGDIRQGLEIVPIKKSDLVTINFISENPEVAATVANTYANEYIQFTQESKLKPTQLGGIRLEKQVADMKVKLETSEKKLNEYIAKSQFLFTKDDKDYENLLTKKFSILSEELNKATSERISKEAIYKEVNKSGVDYTFVLENPVIRSLTMEYIKLESKYFELLKIHKPEYPRMLQLKDQIETLKNKIEGEEQKIINTLHSDYSLALKKENLLSAAIGKLRQDVTAFQHNMIDFQILKRDVETNREIYNQLLQRLKEVDISSALTESDVEIIDEAKVPRSPFKPKKAFNILLSLVFGLSGGVFLAFFAEYFDNSIKTDADVEKIARLPVLGKVPIAKTNPLLLVREKSSDSVVFSEAFRSISACLQFTNVSRIPRHILITSPMESEGKTLISTSIAKNLMNSQEKGIMIDADLRRPDLHTLFNLDNRTGLSSFLAGISEFEGLIKKSPYPGLDAITAGPVPPNPSELLNSPQMRELVDALSAAYDYIIFDSAPVLGMSDTLILSTLVECVILVVKANTTPADALGQTNKALKNVNANIIGVVLNGVDIKSSYSYSSYYSHHDVKGNGSTKKLL